MAARSAGSKRPAGIGRCKHLTLRHRNRLIVPFQKQVYLGGAEPTLIQTARSLVCPSPLAAFHPVVPVSSSPV